MAERNRCSGIRVQPVREFCDLAANRWVFKATVYKSPGSRGFGGYGDADPSNVSDLVRGAEMRMAETRAVNRALRKAYGIGLCSVEELGSFARSDRARPRVHESSCRSDAAGVQQWPPTPARPALPVDPSAPDSTPPWSNSMPPNSAEPRISARPTPERVEAFINNLAERAAKDRAGLLCQLNSYARPQEAKS